MCVYTTAAANVALLLMLCIAMNNKLRMENVYEEEIQILFSVFHWPSQELHVLFHCSFSYSYLLLFFFNHKKIVFSIKIFIEWLNFVGFQCFYRWNYKKKADNLFVRNTQWHRWSKFKFLSLKAYKDTKLLIKLKN